MSQLSGRLLLRPHDLAELLGISISTLYRLERQGTLPPKVRMSSRVSGWRRADVEEWLRGREEVRP